MPQTRLLIADDQPLIRDGLAAIFNMEKEYQVVAKTGDGLETIEQVKLHRPDLVLMDVQMPKLDGLKVTKYIKTEFPDTTVLILTTFEDEEYIWKAITFGASGFLVKGTETETILSIVRECLDGRINFPKSIQQRLSQALQTEKSEDHSVTNLDAHSPKNQPEDRWDSFTIQERNILRLLQQGKSNHAIAAELYLSTGTVKNYLSIIYRKLDVTNRSEAIAYLFENEF